MQSDLNDEQSAKASPLISVNIDPGANVNVAIVVHPLKHADPRTSTDGGR
jgi:hypothetical protein